MDNSERPKRVRFIDDDEKKEDEIEQTKNIKDKKQYINILKYTGLPFIYKKLLRQLKKMTLQLLS